MPFYPIYVFNIKEVYVKNLYWIFIKKILIININKNSIIFFRIKYETRKLGAIIVKSFYRINVEDILSLKYFMIFHKVNLVNWIFH